MKRTVKVLADASYCSASGEAGWGAIVEWEDRVRSYSGTIRGIKDSVSAEVVALATGIRLAIDVLDLDCGDVIEAKSDNLAALDLLRQVRTDRSFDADAAECLMRHVRRKGVVLRLEHQRGHCGFKTRPTATNAAADQMARAGLAWGRLERIPA
ncbi:MAG: hypothetical protein HQL38_01565 [Alphaproteobacteria bacterium]|nr:hypothetical protein [Alphaproteobacteria bacterium]